MTQQRKHLQHMRRALLSRIALLQAQAERSSNTIQREQQRLAISQQEIAVAQQEIARCDREINLLKKGKVNA